MRTGISISITPADADRLRALVKDRNAPQKHVWRAQIVLLSAEGVGTNAIMRETDTPRPDCAQLASCSGPSRTSPVGRACARP
jgi:hypothetical protein